MHLAGVEQTGQLEGVLIRLVAPPAGPQAQRDVVGDLVTHESLPDELLAPALEPLGHQNVLWYAEVLDELLRVPQRVWCGRHVVTAHRLRVSADVQRERAFPAG